MGEILKMTAFLVLVCAVSAVALAFTNAQTKPLIDEQERKKEESARKEVLSVAVKFEKVEGEYLRGLDASGKVVGFVGKAASKGFGGAVEVMVGFDPLGRVTGVKVLKHKETPGLGTKVTDPKGPVIQSMLGKGLDKMKLRKDDPRGEVDAVTGVTITSRAVADAVRTILEGAKGFLSQE
ncbi:MAG: RnfABCDGE type electron transport complex subunit G [Planctomycetota bacterium]|jgi:electron transport complex protein RnfG